MNLGIVNMLAAVVAESVMEQSGCLHESWPIHARSTQLLKAHLAGKMNTPFATNTDVFADLLQNKQNVFTTNWSRRRPSKKKRKKNRVRLH